MRTTTIIKSALYSAVLGPTCVVLLMMLRPLYGSSDSASSFSQRTMNWWPYLQLGWMVGGAPAAAAGAIGGAWLSHRASQGASRGRLISEAGIAGALLGGVIQAMLLPSIGRTVIIFILPLIGASCGAVIACLLWRDLRQLGRNGSS